MGATMKDIARVTGLGLATISSYLNGGNVREKNRIKIEAAIDELDFEVNEVARGLKTNRTKTIGIIIPELNNIFCAEIITEVEDVLRNHGYATMICDCRTDAAREAEAAEVSHEKGTAVVPDFVSRLTFPVNKLLIAGEPSILPQVLYSNHILYLPRFRFLPFATLVPKKILYLVSSLLQPQSHLSGPLGHIHSLVQHTSLQLLL